MPMAGAFDHDYCGGAVNAPGDAATLGEGSSHSSGSKSSPNVMPETG